MLGLVLFDHRGLVTWKRISKPANSVKNCLKVADR